VEENSKQPRDQEEQAGNSSSIMAGPHIISYNLWEDERPGGMKGRFKVRIETGRKAAVTEARQAEALKELLRWARQHRTHHQQDP
jgi:hypothetical protein